jgi:hypothetical protein
MSRGASPDVRRSCQAKGGVDGRSDHGREAIIPLAARAARHDRLQRVQPAMTGLIDGSLSTLAPIFAVALATHCPI